MVTVGFLVLAFVSWGPSCYALGQSQWMRQHPRSGILAWEMLGLIGLAAISGAGVSFTLSSFHGSMWTSIARFIVYLEKNGGVSRLGLLGAMGLSLGGAVALTLCVLVVTTSLRLSHDRRQHRRLVDVIAKPWSPGVLLIEHSAPTAYFVPGHGGRVVITRGMTKAVETSALAAVIDHEKSHQRHSHALVALPFTALYSIFKWIPFVAQAHHAIAHLVEFVADDDAARSNGREPLISALAHFRNHPPATPSCAIGIDGGFLDIRIERLRDYQSTSSAAILFLLGTLATAVIALSVV